LRKERSHHKNCYDNFTSFINKKAAAAKIKEALSSCNQRSHFVSIQRVHKLKQSLNQQLAHISILKTFLTTKEGSKQTLDTWGIRNCAKKKLQVLKYAATMQALEQLIPVQLPCFVSNLGNK
jgi:hypothetical protein